MQKLTPLESEKFQIFAGGGLSAEIGGETVAGGNEQFISRFTEIPKLAQDKANFLYCDGKSVMFFSRGEKYIGLIAVSDKIKSDSCTAISDLKKMGIHTVMLSGDNEISAGKVSASLGIDEVFSSLKPDEKEKIIRTLRANARVAMVGDGINDAPSLTSADVGIAIGAGTDIAIDSADVVLVNSNPTDAVAAVRLGKAALKTIRQNLFWAFIYNVICIPVAAGAFTFIGISLSPMLAAAAMSLSSICVVTNALRLNFIKIKKSKKIIEKEEKTMTKTLKIEGMMCPHCEARVKKILETASGVIAADVSHVNGIATITLNSEISDEKLKEIITGAGYELISVE